MAVALAAIGTALARVPLGFVFVGIFVMLIMILAMPPKTAPSGCPRCGEARPSRANYCAHCGRNLRQP